MVMRNVLREHAIYNSSRVALVDGEMSLTFSRLRERALRLNNALTRMGATAGDRIAILSPNSHSFYEWYFACCEGGFIGAPINARLNASEMLEYLNYVAPRVLLVDERLADMASALQGNVRGLKDIVGIGTEDSTYLDYEQLLKDASPLELGVDVAPERPCLVVATSGTTGVYKGALMTQEYTYLSVLSFLTNHRVTRNSRWLQTLPMFFASGGPAHFTALVAGATTYIVPSFDSRTCLEMIRNNAMTHAYFVPTMLREIVNLGDKADLDSLEVVGVGGSTLTQSLFEAAIDLLGPNVYVTYGCSEGWGTTLTPADYWSGSEPNHRLASVGKPHPNISLGLVRSDGTTVTPGGNDAGEIVFRGPCLSRGYWQMPEETALAFRDGWFHTGDVGTLDEDGFIYIVDRIKDIIISGGINISSPEVEDVVAAHPAVENVAVIGVPDEVWGEAVKAIVQLKPGRQVSEDDIIDWCRARMASFKRPRSVDFADELPMTASGKILKRELRNRFGL